MAIQTGYKIIETAGTKYTDLVDAIQRQYTNNDLFTVSDIDYRDQAQAKQAGTYAAHEDYTAI